MTLNVFMYMCVFFFFFKQKTAYEMRISDWSSDVCSSDLGSFAFNKYICGEFLVACYFGGEHVWRHDKSTLIFKFHDNTGLIPGEPIRVQKHQVDIPLSEHREIIDADNFAVDLF